MLRHGSPRRRVVSLAVGAAFAAVGTPAFANPSGANVVSGGATFSSNGQTLTITNTPGAIINWQQFSIAKDEVTRFIQQNASSAVLNRVVGQNPSAILGHLQSNGRVFLINPSGISFGQSAVINVAGFAASTLNISDGDFAAGRMKFAGTGSEGSITNAGEISATPGGHVYLVAPKVENEASAIIKAPNGQVVIAAGKTVELVHAQTPDIRVEFTAPNNEAINAGEIVAASGQIGIYGTVVRNSGRVSASRAEVGDGGKIILRATKDVTLEAASRVEANGPGGGEIAVQAKTGTLLVQGAFEAKGEKGQGGRIRLLGKRVGLHGNAGIDASGAEGGGVILVGGDYQGKNASVQNAEATFVGHDVSLRADAGTKGDGGRVVVWADKTNRFYGSISARGGAVSGNGGGAEVSGKKNLVFRPQRIDLSAPLGEQGILLLDPTNIIVASVGATFDSTDTNGNDVLEFGESVGDVTIDALTIVGNIQLQATNDITFNSAVNVDSLQATAGHDIAVNAPVTAVTSVTLTANNKISVGSTISSATTTLNAGASGTTFDLTGGTLTATINGESSTLMGISGAQLSTSAANGFGGSTGTSTFSGISTLNAAGALTGLDAASTWTLGATQAYTNGTATLTFSGFGTLQGGSNTDAFTVTNGIPSLVLRGGAGADVFNLATLTVGSIDIDGEAATDSVHVNGLLTTTGATSLAADTIHLGADIATGSNLSLTGSVVLGNAVTLTTGIGVGDISIIGNLTGGGHVLTLEAGTGAIDATGTMVGLGGLVVETSSTTTFQGAVSSSGGVTLQAGAGDVSFLSGLSAGAPSSFLNTGALQLGDATSDVTVLNGGLTHTAGTTVLGGSVTTGGAVLLDDTILAAGAIATIHAGTNAVTFNSTIDGTGGLDVDAQGTTTFNGVIGGTTALSSLVLRGGGITQINTSTIHTTGSQDYQDRLVVPGAISLTSSGNGAITAVHGDNDFSGPLTISAGRTRITDANDLTLGAVTTNSHIDIHTGDALIIDGAITSGGGWITLLAGDAPGMLVANTANDTDPLAGGVQIRNHINAGTGQVRIVAGGGAIEEPLGQPGAVTASVLTAITLKGDGSVSPAGGADISLTPDTGPGNAAQAINLLSCPADGCPALPIEAGLPSGVAALSSLVRIPPTPGAQYADGELRYTGISGGQPVTISGIGTTKNFYAFVNGAFNLTAFPFSANTVDIEATGTITLDLDNPLQKINDAKVGTLTFTAGDDIVMTNKSSNTIGTASATFDHDLVMRAAGDIALDNSIYLGAGKSLTLAANSDISTARQVTSATGSGSIQMTGNHEVTAGKNITMTGVDIRILGGAVAGQQNASGQTLKAGGTLEFQNTGEIVIRGGASNADSGSGAWVTGGTVKIGTAASRPTRLAIEGGDNTYGWETSNAKDAKRETRQSNAVLKSLGAMSIFLGNSGAAVKEAPTFDGATFSPGNDITFGGPYSLVLRGGTVDSKFADGPGGVVAGSTVVAGKTRTVTSLGAIQAQSLDLEADGSILLQGGASNVRSNATLADTSAVFLVSGQKNIKTTNKLGSTVDGFGSLVVKGGRAYNNSGSTKSTPNIRANANVDPSNLDVQLAGNLVLHGGFGPTGSLTSARLDAGNSIKVVVNGSVVDYTFALTDGGSTQTLTGRAFMIGGSGSGFLDKVNAPVPVPSSYIDINVTMARGFNSSLGDAVVQVGRPVFDSSLLGYVIFAANEETRAGRIRKGLGEGDDLGAPACK